MEEHLNEDSTGQELLSNGELQVLEGSPQSHNEIETAWTLSQDGSS